MWAGPVIAGVLPGTVAEWQLGGECGDTVGTAPYPAAHSPEDY